MVALKLFSLPKTHDAYAALTVRLPGARIAPATSTWTCGHRRLENSGTKGLSRCSIVVGRVRIITSLWRRLAMIVPYPLSHQMDKVELQLLGLIGVRCAR